MVTRRHFLGTAAGAAAALWTSPWSLGATGVAPSDQINLGVIGVGSRGRWMLEQALRHPGIRVGGLGEIYTPYLQGIEDVLPDANVPVYADYRQLLDDANLDAVIIATPLGVHAGPMIAAAERGVHIYGEKALAFTQNECDRVVQAVGAGGVHFQIGHQYRHAPRVKEALRRVLAGEIGHVTHIYAYWHRNNDWRRPVPSPEDELHVNWRLYDTWSRGLLAELGSHQIDMANWVFGEMPTMVFKDGRQTYDNVQALFTYPSGGTLFFSSVLSNRRMGYQIRIFGTEGTVELRFEDAWIAYEPYRNNSAVPEPENDEAWVRASPSLAPSGDMPTDGLGDPITLPDDAPQPSADYASLDAFFTAVRTGTRPWADEHVGWRATAPVIAGQRAIRTGTSQQIPQAPVG